MMPNPSFPCIFCDARPGQDCTPGCPSPRQIDAIAANISGALGLDLESDR